MTTHSDALGDRLRRVYWLGGGGCAGKSTLARRLAASHGMQLYSTDAAMADHADRCTPEDCPAQTAFKAMDEGLPVIKFGPAMTVDDLASRVADRFGI